MIARRMVCAMAGLAAWVALGHAPALAQEPDLTTVSREYTIKAAYLYNFARYVTWPEGAFATAESPLVIGVLGEDPFGDALGVVARTKRIDGRAIVVQQFDVVESFRPCHILFVTWNVGEEAEGRAIQKSRGKGVLLVGETPTFIERGGIISFFVEENKVRFEISTAHAQQERLKISSKLLSLARLVGRSPSTQTRMASRSGVENRLPASGATSAFTW